MLRLVAIGLLLLTAGVHGMIVRRQTHPDCQFELLPVLNVCPPCQPSGCYCADGKVLTLEDQRVAEESKTVPCNTSEQNPYGFPARCDCAPPGEGFSFQDVIDQVRAAAQQQAGIPEPPTEAPQEVAAEQAQPDAQERQDPIQSAPGPAPAGTDPSCPRPVLPILNACPPCIPTGCFCADGKELTLEDQAKAHQNQTPPCPPGEDNPYGLPARCSCADPGSGFTFQEILAILAQQQAQASAAAAALDTTSATQS